MKFCIVVPVFNGEPFIQNVLKDLLSLTSLDILVVDDGSSSPVQFEDPSGRLQIHRFDENQGKGKALQWAFKHCFQKGYSHILSFDGDGQHKASDVKAMVKASQTRPAAMILGARRFSENVPGISRFGRKFSNFWVKYQTGLKVSDSQSGLRVYPLEKLADIHFYSGRYDFEIEVLVRGIWRGIPVYEVEVEVEYPEERVSHFNKFKDNSRITALNICLIAWSLVFYQRSWPRKMVVALLSVFIYSMEPFWLALLTGVLACIIFRLNAILMLLCIVALRLF